MVSVEEARIQAEQQRKQLEQRQKQLEQARQEIRRQELQKQTRAELQRRTRQQLTARKQAQAQLTAGKQQALKRLKQQTGELTTYGKSLSAYEKSISSYEKQQVAYGKERAEWKTAQRLVFEGKTTAARGDPGVQAKIRKLMRGEKAAAYEQQRKGISISVGLPKIDIPTYKFVLQEVSSLGKPILTAKEETERGGGYLSKYYSQQAEISKQISKAVSGVRPDFITSLKDLKIPSYTAKKIADLPPLQKLALSKDIQQGVIFLKREELEKRGVTTSTSERLTKREEDAYRSIQQAERILGVKDSGAGFIPGEAAVPVTKGEEIQDWLMAQRLKIRNLEKKKDTTFNRDKIFDLEKEISHIKSITSKGLLFGLSLGSAVISNLRGLAQLPEAAKSIYKEIREDPKNIVKIGIRLPKILKQEAESIMQLYRISPTEAVGVVGGEVLFFVLAGVGIGKGLRVIGKLSKLASRVVKTALKGKKGTRIKFVGTQGVQDGKIITKVIFSKGKRQIGGAIGTSTIKEGKVFTQAVGKVGKIGRITKKFRQKGVFVSREGSISKPQRFKLVSQLKRLGKVRELTAIERRLLKRLQGKGKIKLTREMEGLLQVGIGRVVQAPGKKLIRTAIVFPTSQLKKIRAKGLTIKDFISISAVFTKKDWSLIIGKTLTKKKDIIEFIGLIKATSGKTFISFSPAKQKLFTKALKQVVATATATTQRGRNIIPKLSPAAKTIITSGVGVTIAKTRAVIPKPIVKPKVVEEPVVSGLFGGKQIFFQPPSSLPKQISTAKQKFSLMASQGVGQKTLQQQAFKLLTLQKQRQQQKQQSALSIRSSLLQSQSQRVKQKQALKQQARQKSSQALRSLALLRTRQRQRQALLLRQITPTRLKFRPPPRQIPIIPILPKGVRSTPTITALGLLGKQGVDILVGQKEGKKRIIARNVPPFKALKFGTQYIDKHIDASVRFLATGKNITKKDSKPFNISNKFRPSKRNPLIVVEKKQFRLDHPQELREFLRLKKKKPKKEKFMDTSGFDVVVGGVVSKEKTIAENLPRNKALFKGREFTDKNLPIKFKINPSNKKASGDDIDPFRMGKKFKQSSIGSNTFFESKPFRLDHPQERKQFRGFKGKAPRGFFSQPIKRKRRKKK